MVTKTKGGKAMTTIAFDGNVLAVDRAAWKGDTCYEAVKIFKVALSPSVVERFYWFSCNEILWAVAGYAHDVSKVLRWMESGAGLPTIEGDHASVGVVVPTEKRIGRAGYYANACYGLSKYMTLDPIDSVPFADGAGHEMALGAMLAGADAIKAVEIVASRSSMSRFGVDWYDFRSKEFGDKT
jgi:hypothetical protein